MPTPSAGPVAFPVRIPLGRATLGPAFVASSLLALPAVAADAADAITGAGTALPLRTDRDLDARPAAEVPVAIPGEWVLSIESDAVITLPADLAGDDDRDARILLQWIRRSETRTTTLVHVRTDAAATPADVARRFAGLGDLEWIAPNRRITADPRELVPNDPQFAAQYHHDNMQNAAAWDVTLGDASIVIAVTDDGTDIGHEDIAPGLWANPFEIPGDGVDNDFNGFIDDVVGVDLIGGDGDPSPVGGDDHGTHCVGIAAARTDNGIGVSGTAGGATVMPVRFYQSGADWTATLVADAFRYATDAGAHIVTTSYNMNGWVNDPIVLAAFDYLYDGGVLHFNSAGNGSQLNPPRQAFHQTFLVANTDQGDVKAGSSNYGTGVDVAAPGSSILSTILNDGYGTKSGTSMASPNAAGVAALVWSANPTWTRDQVAAQVIGTADDVSAANPGLDGLLGTGRVNSLRALTETVPAPAVREVLGLPADGSVTVTGVNQVLLRWSQVLSPQTVNRPDAIRFEWAGPDNAFGTADDQDLPISWPEYLIAANETPVTVGGDLPGPGAYRFVVSSNVVRNPFGTRLDGDGDGVAGGDLVRTFDACTGIEISADFLESGAGWTVVNGAIDDGAWDPAPAVPIGGGDREDPPSDFDGSGKCFLTDNVDGNSDVDGGPTDLVSAAIDLSATVDPLLSYARWVGSDGGDVMQVSVSNDDGATWVPVETAGDEGGWRQFVFRVSDFVAPTAQVRLRFRVADSPNNSVTEAAIDTIRVLEIDCGDAGPVPGDVNGDGTVGLDDLLAVLAAWGPCPPGGACAADLDGDGTVGLDELLAVLTAWE